METIMTGRKVEDEIRERILDFLVTGEKQAAGALQQRTYAQLCLVVEHYFDGIANTHFYQRIDWRIVQQMFAHIFAQATAARAWDRIGEELYGEMQYLHDHPLVASGTIPGVTE